MFHIGTKKCFAALIAALCILIMPCVTAYAADTPTVTFTNTMNESPDLYITKTTRDTEGNTVATDDEFTFTVRIDGSFYSNEEYLVYNADGEQVYLYEDGESTEDKSGKLTFKTDRNGSFTLKSGQTARFEWVGAGKSYEVYEESASGWTQILPSGGESAVGTVVSDGSTVEFVNVQTPDTETGTAVITVYKTVSFPDGYDIPETPEFTFRITINGRAYNIEDYTITDTASGRTLGTGTTDSDGTFTLKGGQEAVFTVEADVDYKVEELATDGWRVTTASSYEGTTSGNPVLSFNNATASFAVSKTIRESAADIEYDEDSEFTFILTDGDGNVWPGAEYMLYHTDGTPYLEDGEIVTGATDGDGSFTLKSGQTAIFYGIEPGTAYNVSEVKENGFSQIIPDSEDGYTGRTVSNSVELLPFYNMPVETAGNLLVTKTLTYAEGTAPEDSAEFTFILYRYDTETQEYEIVTDAVYTVTSGSSTYSYRTDSEGKFRLLANQTAVFAGLETGDVYKVEETDIPDYYTLHEITVNGETVDEGADAQSTLTQDGAAMEFTNEYSTIPTVDMLPVSGGMGTTIFYLIGLALIAGCAVSLIVRKRTRNP